MRHEVWQNSWQYGALRKDKRTRVFDRHLLALREWRQWTWTWEPRLGNIVVGDKPIELVAGVK